MNIEELKAQLAEKRKANAIRVTNAAQVSRLEAALKQEASEVVFNAKVTLEASSLQTAELQRLVDECEAIIESVPVHNAKTRSSRVWAGSHRYGFGTQIDLMYQLATGILYSCADHKALLVEHTGLNLELLEEVVAAFGTPSYYSRNYHSIVEAKPFNVERVTTCIEVMQSELGVVVNTDALTKDTFELDFVRSETKAQKDYDQAVEAISNADFPI
jgi:hypothetical protein